jgi:hypothetical protein
MANATIGLSWQSFTSLAVGAMQLRRNAVDHSPNMNKCVGVVEKFEFFLQTGKQPAPFGIAIMLLTMQPSPSLLKDILLKVSPTSGAKTKYLVNIWVLNSQTGLISIDLFLRVVRLCSFAQRLPCSLSFCFFK